MIRPVTPTLRANRWTPFVCPIPLEDVDLTGATFAMQVRDAFEGADLHITLASAPAGSEGLSVAVDTSGALPVSTITIQIDKATLASIAEPVERGTDLAAVYDLVVTPAAGDPFVASRGSFIFQAGVTR